MKILIIILQLYTVQLYGFDHRAIPEWWAHRATDNTQWYYFKDGSSKWWESDDGQYYIRVDSARAKYYNQYVERKIR